jgi:hypothetical protein
MERRKGVMVGRGKVEGEIAVRGGEEDRYVSAAVESSEISAGERGWVQRSGWWV